MAPHPESHLIANETRRLAQLPPNKARRELNERIGRAFQLAREGDRAYADVEFQRAIDFNAHLVTNLRRSGVIWPQSA